MSIVSYDQTGYVGSSMSENALLAYEAGEKPKSKWTKKAMLAEIGEFCETLGLAIPAEVTAMKKDDLFSKFFEFSSWHHTSKFANKTNFYDLNGEKVVEVFLAHRNVEEFEKIAENGDWNERTRAAEVAGDMGCTDLLDKLAGDESPEVSDENADVRFAAAKKAGKLEQLADDGDWEVRRKLAEHGVALDKLAGDEDEFVRKAVAYAAGKAGRADLLDKLASDPSHLVREAVVEAAVKAEYDDLLNRLVNDENAFVRRAVACHGHALDALADDPEWRVRFTVAEQGHALDALADDKSKYVRKAVASKAGKIGRADLLEKLADDPEWRVRYEVLVEARETFRRDLLGKLAHDKSADIRKAAASALHVIHQENLRAFRIEHGYDARSVKAYMLAHPDKVTKRTSKRGVAGVDIEFGRSTYFFPLDQIEKSHLNWWKGCVE